MSKPTPEEIERARQDFPAFLDAAGYKGVRPKPWLQAVLDERWPVIEPALRYLAENGKDGPVVSGPASPSP